jgi:hypothetical protein
VAKQGQAVMKSTLILAAVLLLAGSAHAQWINVGTGAPINGLGTINTNGSINDVGSSHPGVATTSQWFDADIAVNANSKNPGEFVPSTYSSYKEALAIGRLDLQVKPTTVVQAARLTREQRSKMDRSDTILVDEDSHGNLVIVAKRK